VALSFDASDRRTTVTRRVASVIVLTEVVDHRHDHQIADTALGREEKLGDTGGVQLNRSAGDRHPT
jgi:hypothetical protein